MNSMAELLFWESVATWGFRAVIVGVAIESVELAKKLADTNWKFSSKFEGRMLIVESLGFLILLSGLAVEYWGANRASVISHSIIADSLKEAADANEKAGTANQAAAEAKLELEKIKQPRTITDKQEKTFIDFLNTANAPRCNVSLYCTSSDLEATRYKNRVREVLENAGHTVTNSHPSEVIAHPVLEGIRGPDTAWASIFLCVPTTNDMTTAIAPFKTPPCVAAMHYAFLKIGINAAGLQLNEYDGPGVPAKIDDWDFVVYVTEKR
jgi:hypothetical protein